MKYNNQIKKEVMILVGQLITIPFVIMFMVLWIKIDIDPIAIAVMITSLIMILTSVTMQICRVTNMIGKES